MSSVFLPKGCCQVKLETTEGEERHSICTRMFGHTECQSGWPEEGQGKTRRCPTQWFVVGGECSLFGFISHSIKHHLLCHFTHSHVSN